MRLFERRHHIRLDHVDALAPLVEVREIPAAHAAMTIGASCPFVFVVRSGLFKQSYVTESGNERIKSFAGPGDFFACIDALEGSPATFSSVAIKRGVVERVAFAAIEDVAERSLGWQKALRIAFQALARLKVARERELLCMTPRQLYDALLLQAPPWLHDVPQKDLAAYLGVTPVGLNRIIRARKAVSAA